MPEVTRGARQRAGHYEVLGETYAKFEFFEAGWNPYSRFLDVDKVDLVLRKRVDEQTVYREVQVKFGKLFPKERMSAWEQTLFSASSWRFFGEAEFDRHADTNLFIAYVLSPDAGYQRDLFIFPVRDFIALIRCAITSGDRGRKMYLSRCLDGRWVLRRVGRKFMSINEETCRDVTAYYRNFALLD